MIDFTKIFLLKGLKLKNKGHMNFYECCDLTKNVYLVYIDLSTVITKYYYLLFFLFFRNEELPRDFRLKENAFQMTTFIFDDIRAKTEKRLELVRMVRGNFCFLGKRQFCEKGIRQKFSFGFSKRKWNTLFKIFRKIFLGKENINHNIEMVTWFFL